MVAAGGLMQLVMEARAGLCRLHRDGARRVDLECAIES